MKETIEYRIAYRYHGEQVQDIHNGIVAARRKLAWFHEHGHPEAVIQTRTVARTPWTDVPTPGRTQT